MRRLIKMLIIALFLNSCKSNSQSKIDVYKSLKLFKEGTDLLKQGITVEYTDSLKAQKYYRESLNKFNAAYKSDTTNLELGTYLSELYSKTQQFDSALIWALRLFPVDSTTHYKDNSGSISDSYGFIGSCYLYEGDLINGKKYFELASKANSHHVLLLTQTLSAIADKLYFETMPVQINKLKAKAITPCKYSLQIMRLGLTLGETEKIARDFLFSKEKLAERDKNCR
jgi:tetratricopeptide (TPR) repeat protein